MHGFAEWLYAMINPPPYLRFILFNEVLSRYRDGPSGKVVRYNRECALPFGHGVFHISIPEFPFTEKQLCGYIEEYSYNIYFSFFLYNRYFFSVRASGVFCECFLAFARRHLCYDSSSTL